jgi:beta-lactamase class A
MFVGSAVKSFILAEYLQQFGVPRHQLSVIDDNIRSISGSVFGFEGSDPEVNLEGTTLTRNVLEAMISHSDNTATDSILADVGADKVRDLIADVGLSSVKIPDSTRRLFAYLASGRNVDVDWETLKEYVNNPPNPQNARSTRSSPCLLLRRTWFAGIRLALLKPGFLELPEELTEYKTHIRDGRRTS